MEPVHCLVHSIQAQLTNRPILKRVATPESLSIIEEAPSHAKAMKQKSNERFLNKVLIKIIHAYLILSSLD